MLAQGQGLLQLLLPKSGVKALLRKGANAHGNAALLVVAGGQVLPHGAVHLYHVAIFRYPLCRYALYFLNGARKHPQVEALQRALAAGL